MLHSIIIAMALCVEPEPHQSGLHVPLATTSWSQQKGCICMWLTLCQRYLLYPPIIFICMGAQSPVPAPLLAYPVYIWLYVQNTGGVRDQLGLHGTAAGPGCQLQLSLRSKGRHLHHAAIAFKFIRSYLAAAHISFICPWDNWPSCSDSMENGQTVRPLPLGYVDTSLWEIYASSHNEGATIKGGRKLHPLRSWGRGFDQYQDLLVTVIYYISYHIISYHI